MTAKILQLDESGIPFRWISVRNAISYHSKDKVLYELGSPLSVFLGGNNKITGKQSSFVINTIISVKGSKFKRMNKNHVPTLNNSTLFERDKYLCAYCCRNFHKTQLSRDHIIPVSRGGLDVWTNVVTACKSCNSHKGSKLLKEAKLNLAYLPYTPDYYENFILMRGEKKILSDQMEFLLSKVSKNSRLK